MAKDTSVEQVIQQHHDSGYFLEVDGIRTFVLDYGEGEPVVCLHGVPTSSFLYRKVLTRLQNLGMRGISFDLPGLGLSARPGDFDYSFRNFANFSGKVINALQLERFHLVVHDMGGPIGFALAAQIKSRILSLTILNTWINVDDFRKPMPMMPFEKPILGDAELALLNHATWYFGFSNVAVSNMSGISKEEAYAYVDLLKREDGGKAFLKIMRNFEKSPEFRTLCYQAVQNVSYPIQAIWGAEDPGLSFDPYGKEIQHAARLSEVIKLPAKHLLQEDQWEPIASRIASIARPASASGAA